MDPPLHSPFCLLEPPPTPPQPHSLPITTLIHLINHLMDYLTNLDNGSSRMGTMEERINWDWELRRSRV